MDLQNSSIKMSQSDETGKGCIYMLNPIAVTDNLVNTHYDSENQPGVSNIYSILPNRKIEKGLREYSRTNKDSSKI